MGLPPTGCHAPAPTRPAAGATVPGRGAAHACRRVHGAWARIRACRPGPAGRCPGGGAARRSPAGRWRDGQSAPPGRRSRPPCRPRRGSALPGPRLPDPGRQNRQTPEAGATGTAARARRLRRRRRPASHRRGIADHGGHGPRRPAPRGAGLPRRASAPASHARPNRPAAVCRRAPGLHAAGTGARHPRACRRSSSGQWIRRIMPGRGAAGHGRQSARWRVRP